MTQKKYLGLLASAVALVQGPNGPQQVSPPVGGAIAIYEVPKFEESSHADLANDDGVANTGLQLANHQPGHFDWAASIANDVYEALKNDGTISPSEWAKIGGNAASQPEFNGALQGVVGEAIGKIRGLFGK